MKIKCKPEGRNDIYIPEKESLKKYIKSLNLEAIHNFVPSGMIMIGADHDVESVLQDIDVADRLAIFTNPGANMGHSMALITDEKLECYDIGRLIKEDLKISN